MKLFLNNQKKKGKSYWLFFLGCKLDLEDMNRKSQDNFSDYFAQYSQLYLPNFSF